MSRQLKKSDLVAEPVPRALPAVRATRSAPPANPYPAWKRVLDISVILLALPVILPVALGILCWIKLVSTGPVLFTQERIGYRGRRFRIFKFRSMSVGAATQSHETHVQKLLSSDEPMTKLDGLGDSRLIPGAGLLRSTGLDELPQLLNVLRGEMSLVGPRPCLWSEYELYDSRQRERFHALPGLTGYWQVNGKNRTTFTEMVALDIHYARNRSLWLDLQIILKTPFAILGHMIHVVTSRRSAARSAQVSPPKRSLHRSGSK